jgi:hypothetical protein
LGGGFVAGSVNLGPVGIGGLKAVGSLVYVASSAGLKVIKYDQYLRAVFDKVPPPPPKTSRWKVRWKRW